MLRPDPSHSADLVDRIADRFRTGDAFVLVPHDRPDGDACGSVLALARALRRAGKRVQVLLPGPIPPRYQFLFDPSTAAESGLVLASADLASAGVAVILDTSARRQLVPMLEWLDRFAGEVIVIDHHARGDVRADLALVDESSPATAVLVARILDRLGWLADPRIAEYLLVGLATDTGWFSYNNVSSGCFAWAARLAECGASLHATYERLFRADSPARFRLLARALGSAELLADDRAVVFTLTRRDFAETGAGDALTENLIDEASRLKSMRIAALFVETEHEGVRVSLRSREPYDVHQLAARFGGGGHRRAAGVKMVGSLAEVRAKVLAGLLEALAAPGSQDAARPGGTG